MYNSDAFPSGRRKPARRPANDGSRRSGRAGRPAEDAEHPRDRVAAPPGTDRGPDRAREASAALALIERVVRECPRRQATSDSERRAHDIVRGELERLGLSTTTHPFEFSDSLYANLALHFGVGAAGHVVGGIAPLLGAGLHALAATSYWGESTRRFYLLRRLLGFKSSRNVLATLPAEGEPRLRIVFLAHVDAAFTGLMFHPKAIRLFATKPPRALRFTSRSLALATRAEAALAGLNLVRALLGPLGLPLRPLEWVLTLPTWIAFGLALEAVLRNEVVPGAADNLSGVAGMLLLAARLAPHKPRDVELVFAATGCEEASLGGADALAREMGADWSTERTIVLALDTLSNGALRFVDREGEVVTVRPPQWLCQLIRETAAADPRFAEVDTLDIPVGGTDAAPFQYRGYAGTSFTCIDPAVGAPRHYHQPTDDPAHVDPAKIVFCVDFVEKVVQALFARWGATP